MLCAAAFGLPWLLWPDGLRWLRPTGGSRARRRVAARFAFTIGRYFVQRIGGYTGDCLGFAQQIFELGIYLTGLAWISS